VTRPVACIIGWPVSHSRSPMIHRYWLRRLGIDGDYVAAPVEPARIDAFLSRFARSGFVGGNVTVPYKEAAFAAVAETDEVASALGAVNTLSLADGRLIGSNTDAYGFLANLDAAAPGWDHAGGTAIVLGAGGAARAVVWSLLQRRLAPVVVVNRTPERAQQLAARLGDDVRPAAWSALPGWLPEARILVNATSLGMRGQPPLEIDIDALPAGATASDLVYAPLETQLLRAARRRGLAAVSGLGMLIHQAVPGFEAWFGERPKVTDALYALVAADLEKKP
jgi:shikimate dehydrogenase